MSDGHAFSERLREATRGAHRDAESAGFIRTLLDGGVPREGYAALVAQHWFIYQALEQAAAAMREHPVVGGFVTDALTRLPALAADLGHLLGPQWQERITLLPATRAYRDRIHEVTMDRPACFVAHHYTRYLGDLSGGQAIRKAVVRTYDLTGGRGASFYDFPELGPVAAFKRSYRARLDALPFDDAEQDELVAEVRTAYRFNSRVFADLQAQLADPFPPPVLAQIAAHMNDDHAADSLRIVRALGGQPEATAVRMTGMDADGLDFAATVAGVEQPVRVPFGRRLGTRGEVRHEVVRLYRDACARLGLDPASYGRAA